MQTVYSFWYDESPKDYLAEERVSISLEDGDIVSLDINGLAHRTSKLVVFLAHGLGGSSESAYKKRLAKKLNNAGIITVRFNHRGSELESEGSLKTYHSGSTDDLKKAIEYTENRWSHCKLVVIGFSLSGTIMMNMLTESDENEFKNVSKFISVCFSS